LRRWLHSFAVMMPDGPLALACLLTAVFIIN
jgi:hypothetical protein